MLNDLGSAPFEMTYVRAPSVTAEVGDLASDSLELRSTAFIASDAASTPARNRQMIGADSSHQRQLAWILVASLFPLITLIATAVIAIAVYL